MPSESGGFWNMLKFLCRQRQGDLKDMKKYTISYEFTGIDYEGEKRVLRSEEGSTCVYAENDFEAGYKVSRRDLGINAHNFKIMSVKELEPHKVAYTEWTGVCEDIECECIAYGDIEDIENQIIYDTNRYNVRIID